MGRTALMLAFAQSDVDMGGFSILNCPTFNVGIVSSVGLVMPEAFSVTNSPVTGSGELTVEWSGAVIPVAILPVAVGIGAEHAAGLVPDPGVEGNGSDYLGRDMTWRPVPSLYQPVVPVPTMSISGASPPYTVNISSAPLAGVSLFYSMYSAAGPFQAVPSGGNVTGVYTGDIVYAYGALTGYTNSPVVFLTAPPPLSSDSVTGDDAAAVVGDDAVTVTVGP